MLREGTYILEVMYVYVMYLDMEIHKTCFHWRVVSLAEKNNQSLLSLP